MKFLKSLITTALAATVALGAAPASAATVIDFENAPSGFYGPELRFGTTLFVASTILRVVPVDNAAGSPTNTLCAHRVDQYGNELCGSTLTVAFADPVSDLSLIARNISAFDTLITALVTLADGSSQYFDFADTTPFADRLLTFAGLTDIKAVQFTTTDELGAGVAYDDFRFTAAGAVPEPATWAMLIAGFGLLGAGLRRRTLAPRLS